MDAIHKGGEYERKNRSCCDGVQAPGSPELREAKPSAGATFRADAPEPSPDRGHQAVSTHAGKDNHEQRHQGREPVRILVPAADREMPEAALIHDDGDDVEGSGNECAGNNPAASPPPDAGDDAA